MYTYRINIYTNITYYPAALLQDHDVIFDGVNARQ